MGKKEKAKRGKLTRGEEKIQKITQTIIGLLGQGAKVGQSKTENDFCLGKATIAFRKCCWKYNFLSVKLEFEERIPKLSLSKAKALEIMVVRSDIKKYPSLLWLESHRLIKLAAYVKKGKQVSDILIENDLGGILYNEIGYTTCFLSEVDELIEKLEQRADEAESYAAMVNAGVTLLEHMYSNDLQTFTAKLEQFFNTYKKAVERRLMSDEGEY